MYYKLYRRRQYIYLGIFVACVLFLLLQKSQINDDSRHGDKQNHIEENPNIPHMPLDKDDADNKLPQKKPRVNMQNYVEPPICRGCPGENGAAVFLNVSVRRLFYFRVKIWHVFSLSDKNIFVNEKNIFVTKKNIFITNYC